MEDLPPKPQEKAMQAAEREQLAQADAEDQAKQTHEAAQEQRQQERDSRATGSVGYPDRSSDQGYAGTSRDSVFYPLVEAVRSALLKECKYPEPSYENAAALKSQMVILEDKYRIYRFGPEVMASAYFVSPFVSGYMIHIKEHPPGWIRKRDVPSEQRAATDEKPAPVSQPAPAPSTANNAGAAQTTALGGSAQQRAV